MRKFLFSFVLLAVTWTTAMALAVPAMPGLNKVTQSDGTTLTIQAVGDEWYHLLYTTDNLVVDRGNDGDFYYVTTSGLSKIKAHDAAYRDNAELSFIKSNRHLMTVEALQEADKKSGNLRNIQTNGFNLNKVSVPQTNTPRIPIILVQFTDKSMSNSASKIESHFSDESGSKSVYKYFKDQSNGKFTPKFDVYGIYTLDHTRAYYGQDGSSRDQGQSGSNGRGQVVKDAILKAGNDIDWSLYDNDNNGSVDVCMVVYAGVGQAQATSVTDALWPCRWTLDAAIGTTMYRNGKTINDFAIFNEVGGKYDYNTALDGIGTFCHEFSHCLGLPDFYVTGSSGYSNTGLSDWSVMANGCYDGSKSSDTPIGYSAFEKHFMGWMDYIEPNEGNQYTMPVLNNQSNPNDAAVVVKALYDTPYKYEYWVLEYRKAQGWDINIPAEGVLISHYTYIYDKWNSNQANYLNQLQGAEIVGSAYGKGYKNAFTSSSSPAMKAYLNESGTDCHTNPIAVDKPVTDIKVNSDGTASLWYMKGTTPTLSAPVIGDATNVNATSFTANWTHNSSVSCNYTLNVTKNGTTVIEQEGITSTSYTITGLTSGETYSFKVKALPVNSTEASQSDWSASESVTLPQSPTIAVSNSSVDFSGFATKSYTQSVNVTGINLSQNITASLIDANSIYSIDKNSISNTANGATLNITWAPRNAGNTTATIVLSSAGAEDVTINITGDAQAATPTLITATNALSFTAAPNRSVTKTVPLTGLFITNNVTLTLNDPSNVFSINSNNIAASSISEDNPVNVEVTFNSAEVGTFAGTLIISSEGAESKTIELLADASNGGKASDAYLDIAKYATIDDAGASVDGMLSIYNFAENESEGYAWLTISNYGATKADNTQGWFTNSITKTASGSWNSNDVFPGSQTFFGGNTSYVCDWNGNYQTFYVTNCTQVKQYVTNRASWYPLYMRIYECSKDADGTLIAESEAFDTQKSSVYGSESKEIISSKELSADKIYKVEIFNDCSYLYAIAFKTEFNNQPIVPSPTLSVTPTNLAFSCYNDEIRTDTITVTGENLTSDVTVALTGNNTVFSINKTNISKNEAQAGAKVVVTFNPQEAGNYDGLVTLTSGEITKTINLNGSAQVHTPVLEAAPEQLAMETFVGEEVSQTFAITGQYITSDVTITSDNENFTVNPATIEASALADGNSVNVTVTFNPEAEGNFTGNLTIASEGAEALTVALYGVAQVQPYTIVTPVANKASKIGFKNFTANWSACTGATSYTLRVVPKTTPVLPPVTPPSTASLIMTENFAKCTSTVLDFISLDNYTDNPGWSYTRVYVENGGLRIGSKYAGTLTSPALDLSESNGKVSVKVKAKAYNSDTNCSLTITCGDATQTVDIPNSTEVEHTVVLDCTAAQGQNITFKNNGTNKRVIITSVEFYSGDITANVASAPALNANGSDTIIITGITSNSYKVTGLKTKTTYIYDVKAVYGDEESDWSNQIEVTTFNSSYYLDEIIKRNELDNEFVIRDDLVVVHVNPTLGLAWCKGQTNTSTNATEIRDGQIDFMRDIVGVQTSEWDQSDWIMLKFPEDNGNNGIREMLENAVGKTIAAESLAGRYIDNVNYTLEVLPENDVYTLTLANDANYEKNHYCTANFLPTNLNINGGMGAIGRDNGEEVCYFFMNPKIQEVCEITNAQFDVDGVFVVPSNSHQIVGSVKVDWSYNANGVQWPEKGKIYHFMAVVNRMTGDNNGIKDEQNSPSDYIVYPLDFTSSGSATTAINTIKSNSDVIGVEYVNVSGNVSDKPFQGVNIVVTHYSDGSSTVTKKLYK